MYSYIMLKKKKEYETESVKEVNRITPAGPTPYQAAEGSEALHRIPEI